MKLKPSKKTKIVIISLLTILTISIITFVFIVNSNHTSPQPKPSKTVTQTPKPTPKPTPIKEYPISLLQSGVKLGAFAPPSPNKNDGMSSITALESELGARIEVVNWFVKWGDEYNQFTTPSEHTNTMLQLEQASTDGRTPMITWEPWAKGDDIKTTGSFSMASITGGEHDEYITSWAKGLAGFGNPVYIRFAHEMNGNWYPWSQGSNASKDYIEAWKHVVDVFRANNATNVQWIWAPAQKNFNGHLEDYYPGDDYVDVLGSSLYNCHSEGWASFKDLLQPAYDGLTGLNNTKPVWVTELGTCDPTGGSVENWDNESRADWYAQIFNNTTFPNLKMIVLFDAIGQQDWQIAQGSDSANSLRNAYSQSAGWVAPPQIATQGVQLPAVTNLKNDVKDKTVNALSWDKADSAQGYVIKRDSIIVATTLDTQWSEYNINDSTDRTYTIYPIQYGVLGLPASLTIK